MVRRNIGKVFDLLWFFWSERRDLNSGPPVPQTGALTGLRYAPNGADYSDWGKAVQPTGGPPIAGRQPRHGDFPLREFDPEGLALVITLHDQIYADENIIAAAGDLDLDV
jgi:hypothetical protein